MPRVSVIIPAYNAASTIRATIRSVQRQTLQDFEIVVIDDGCTDDTVQQVETIGDERIALYSYANGGLPAARNRGIGRARGNYLAFLDADDLWSSQKLESHVALLDQRREVGAVYSWSCTIDAQDRVLGAHHASSWEGDVYARLLRAFFIGNASNAIVRRGAVDAVGLFDESLDRGEDWEFLTRLASRWPFVAVRDYQVFYRQRDGSISSDVERMRDGLFVACEKMFAAAPAGLQHLKITSLANIHIYAARSYLTRKTDHKSLGDAARSLLTVLRLQPRLLLDSTGVRLCLRWLIAALLSPQAAASAAHWYHRSRLTRHLPEADPWT
jgi:glycosyltransferase involved in cell wall biosynthesis